MGRFNKLWAAVILLLVILIVVGSIFIWSKANRNRPIEITLPTSPETSRQITVTGAVNVPGIYVLKAGDSIDDLLQAAGGATAAADPDGIKLHIPSIDETEAPQKVNLNRARSGRFSHISEITKVEGIGTATYEKIKHLITISD